MNGFEAGIKSSKQHREPLFTLFHPKSYKAKPMARWVNLQVRTQQSRPTTCADETKTNGKLGNSDGRQRTPCLDRRSDETKPKASWVSFQHVRSPARWRDAGLSGPVALGRRIMVDSRHAHASPGGDSAGHRLVAAAPAAISLGDPPCPEPFPLRSALLLVVLAGFAPGPRPMSGRRRAGPVLRGEGPAGPGRATASSATGPTSRRRASGSTRAAGVLAGRRLGAGGRARQARGEPARRGRPATTTSLKMPPSKKLAAEQVADLTQLGRDGRPLAGRRRRRPPRRPSAIRKAELPDHRQGPRPLGLPARRRGPPSPPVEDRGLGREPDRRLHPRRARSEGAAARTRPPRSTS